MKTLFLLRHAKAENAAGGSRDFDRALNDRGRAEAQAIGRFLKKQNLNFEPVLSSPALRARETTELVLAAAGLDVDVRLDQRIYEASSQELLTLLLKMEQETSVLVLVGHNPALEDLIRTLTGRAEHMSPGTLAQINFDVEQWQSVRENSGTLELLVKPKEPGAGEL